MIPKALFALAGLVAAAGCTDRGAHDAEPASVSASDEYRLRTIEAYVLKTHGLKPGDYSTGLVDTHDAETGYIVRPKAGSRPFIVLFDPASGQVAGEKAAD